MRSGANSLAFEALCALAAAQAEARRVALEDVPSLAEELRIGPYVKIDALRSRVEDFDAEVKP